MSPQCHGNVRRLRPMNIITSGASYLDIDAYCIAYAELLRKELLKLGLNLNPA